MAEVVEATKVGGATLTKLLGTSAWYAPGAAVSELVKAIALDSKKMFACSALLEGEYGLNDISLGVPCVLGKNGIEKIIEISLSDAEKEKLVASAEDALEEFYPFQNTAMKKDTFSVKRSATVTSLSLYFTDDESAVYDVLEPYRIHIDALS